MSNGRKRLRMKKRRFIERIAARRAKAKRDRQAAKRQLRGEEA